MAGLSAVLLSLAVGTAHASSRGDRKYDVVDACLKQGAAWNWRTDGCETPDPGPVDYIRVYKRNHWMVVYRAGRIVREFRISIGRGGLGPKLRQGDRRVPDGLYRIAEHRPYSGYHLAMRIGYPTAEQLATAREAGIDPGGDIMIHGLPNGLGYIGSRQTRIDWTAGCVAVTDPEIEWLWRAVPDGTPIEIVE